MNENSHKSNCKEDKYHGAIQSLLLKFKKNSGNENFSFYFKSNPDVYICEPQVPDIWLRTRKPFDKNQCFEFENGKESLKENFYPK